MQLRPNSIDLNRVKAIRQLFIVKFFSQKVTSDTLVIKIDETLINRNMKINYL